MGLPLLIRVEARLSLDGSSGLVREIAISSVELNGRPLLPRLIADLVARVGGGGNGGGGGSSVEAFLAGLVPWLRP